MSSVEYTPRAAVQSKLKHKKMKPEEEEEGMRTMHHCRHSFRPISSFEFGSKIREDSARNGLFLQHGCTAVYVTFVETPIRPTLIHDTPHPGIFFETPDLSRD